MTLRGDVLQVLVPHIAHPEQIGFARFGRLIVADIRFGERFVFADAEQMHVDAEPVERLLEIAAIRGEAGEQHAFFAARMQQDAVGVRGEIVLALRHAVGYGDDFLAGGLEAIERRANFAQCRQPGAFNVVGFDDDAFDVRIVRGRIDRAQDVAQLHFAHFLAEQSAERALCGVGRVLLDDVALRIEHQRGVVFDFRTAHAHRDDEHHDDDDEDDIHDEPSREIDQRPQPDEESDEPPVLPFRHGNFLRYGIERNRCRVRRHVTKG